MKVIANLTGFSLNRQIIVETGTEKELRGHNVLVVAFFLKRREVNLYPSRRF